MNALSTGLVAVSVATFSCGGSGGASSAMAAARSVSAAPRRFIDTTYVPPKGKALTSPAGGDLQAALDSAQPGDTIVLEAGATFAGPFQLPAKSGDDWIYIQSSRYEKLPSPGERVS